MESKDSSLIVLIRGAGDIASAVACRLVRSHFRVCLTDIAQPQAVRRGVAFSEAIYEGEKGVEGVVARYATSPDLVFPVWAEGKVPILVDPEAKIKSFLKPDVLVDAIIAKRNLGTKISDAPLVIGLGPGFEAGKDVHAVVETNRGHNLGKVMLEGAAEPDTGIPGEIGGVSAKRVLRAPRSGRLSTVKNIGDHASAGEVVALVDGCPVEASIAGVVRGLLRDGAQVHQGMKMGDIDPRGTRDYCFTISDKARAIAGGVLEVILWRFNGGCVSKGAKALKRE